MIDLHIHSNASDGSLSPSEIMKEAIDQGLSAIAITDHDTVSGVKLVIESGIPHPLEFITGIEISAHPPVEYADIGTLHILGYGISIYDTMLQKNLKKLKDARRQRNPQIIEKLKKLGFPLTLEEVKAICGPGQMGRPHIARAMVQKGYVSSFDKAFDLYLGSGKPAYVDKFRLTSQQAIDLIMGAGGLAVLAHPGLIPAMAYPSLPDTLPSKEETSISHLISRLMGMGLAGIEVYHTDHSPEQTAFFEKLATKKRLLMTGGSDFHGDLKPKTAMGKGEGTLHVDYALYKTLCMAVDDDRLKRPVLEKLEQNLYHTFADRSLLQKALYHSSYVNEMQHPDMEDNQRLEFLGDAVLGLAIGHLLMKRFPDMKEGDLSKLRASLVSEPGLADMARIIDLGRFIYLGKGEHLSRGAEKSSILSDTFEAVVAAIYLEIGFDATFELIDRHFAPQIAALSMHHGKREDYKSMLQEVVQEMGDSTPCYTVSGESGPDHDKIFEITLTVYDVKTQGEGKNKKAAEQDAAAKALTLLSSSPDCPLPRPE